MEVLPICYICGKEIRPGEASTDDHRVQKLLLQGAQPRRRGFDYGGVAPTHLLCNTGFRDEVHAATALRILRALHEPDAMLTGVHPDDPSIPIQALNSEIFGAFTPGELAFFQIADATGSDALPGLEEILSGTKTNLAAHAVPIALSVLLKSSVALLVDRHGLSSSGPRIIWATAWTTTPDFADHLREDGFKPFHEDVFWKVNVEDDVIEVRYFAHGVLVYFWFLPKRNLLLEQQMIAALPQVDHFLFEGVSLLNLQTRRWRLVYQAEVPQRRNAECLCGSGVRFKHCHGAALTFR